MLRRHAAYMDFVDGLVWRAAAAAVVAAGDRDPRDPPAHRRPGHRLDVPAATTIAAVCCSAATSSRRRSKPRRLKDADWRIALLHHPWEYLAEFDHHQARSAVHQHRDLLLRGHLHQPLSERVCPPDPSRQCLELAAGCVYEHSQYPNAFQWIELSPTGKRVRVLFRAWLHNAWTIDRNQPDCPEGHGDFDLAVAPAPARRGRSDPPRKSRPTTWPGLSERCARVESAGAGDQKGHALHPEPRLCAGANRTRGRTSTTRPSNELMPEGRSG